MDRPPSPRRPSWRPVLAAAALVMTLFGVDALGQRLLESQGIDGWAGLSRLAAVTVGQVTVYLTPHPDVYLWAHEAAHRRQFAEHGWVRMASFYVRSARRIARPEIEADATGLCVHAGHRSDFSGLWRQAGPGPDRRPEYAGFLGRGGTGCGALVQKLEGRPPCRLLRDANDRMHAGTLAFLRRYGSTPDALADLRRRVRRWQSGERDAFSDLILCDDGSGVGAPGTSFTVPVVDPGR